METTWYHFKVWMAKRRRCADGSFRHPTLGDTSFRRLIAADSAAEKYKSNETEWKRINHLPRKTKQTNKNPEQKKRKPVEICYHVSLSSLSHKREREKNKERNTNDGTTNRREWMDQLAWHWHVPDNWEQRKHRVDITDRKTIPRQKRITKEIKYKNKVEREACE